MRTGPLLLAAGLTATGLLGAGLLRTVSATRNYYWEPVSRALSSGFTERRVELRPGLTLNLAEGPSTGRIPLLLIPGQGSIWQDYARVLPDLAQDFHVVAVDVHGHGGSTWRPSDYTCTGIADDLVNLGRQVFGAPFLVSGHSSGGLIAARMAAAHPGDIRGIILEDAPFFATDADRVPGTFVGVDTAAHLEEFLSQDEEQDYMSFVVPRSYFRTVFGALWPRISERVVAQRRADPTATPVIPWLGEKINRIWESISHPYDLWFSHAFFISRTWHDGFDQADTLAAVRCPSLFIKAPTRHDRNGLLLAALDDRDCARVDTLLPDNTVAHVRSGHAVHFEKPGWFVDTVRTFATTL